MTAARTVAAFDFDGTLARGDSLLPFLMRLLGGPKVARAVLRHSGSLGLIGLGRGNRDLTKERFIASTLKNHPAEEIEKLGSEFAAELLETRMFPGMVERLRWHQSEGHETALVSATLDVYLRPLAETLRLNAAITTRLEIVDGRATGRLLGANVRGAEKLRLLKDYLDTGTSVTLYAYGNSSGDHEMLAAADHAFYVDRQGRFSPWHR